MNPWTGSAVCAMNDDFDKTLANIVKFLRTKQQLKSKKPYAILELINFPDIYKDSDRRQRKKFLEHFRGFPLDRIEIKEMHNRLLYPRKRPGLLAG